ncbi:MAG: diguanylate cyclase [Chlamydiia bacterium]|nr:diguanylate cyclase [Chlamydiia bacterium]
MKLKKLPALLLITNSALVRSFFERVVDRLDDYALIIAASRKEALEYLDKTHISFIVIDDKTENLELTALCQHIRTLSSYLHTPIVVITGHLKKSFTRNLIKAGATDFLREPLDEDEFYLRMEMAGGAMETQAKMASLTRHLPTVSGGASLAKRAFLDDRAPRMVEEALQKKTPLTLILLEIDQYSQVLKGRGENVAHALTLSFEDHLQKLMRSQDLFYNQNHGKFAIFLPRTSCKAASFIAENIHETLEAEIFSAGNIRFTLTISIGIATLDQTGDPSKNGTVNLERIMKGATECLTKAKEKTNTIVTKESK